MTKPIISVENLGKRYRVKRPGSRGGGGLRHAIEAGAASLWNGLSRIVQGRAPYDRIAPEDEFWALKDINFEVRAGECVGIIGRNGAGKSTLLKILSRITEPSTGRAVLRGRVGSLLEVGTGFHPELTGRENIFLNGAILGMRRHEINKRMDEIVAFAEVDEFLDTPVKHYSSGMYMRLAFAVAAHLDPEILIVDEVLAVGDVQFQKKCLGKMSEVAKDGRTVLFVSHNMDVISAICQKAIMLEKGQVVAEGQKYDVIEKYMATVSSSQKTSWTGNIGDQYLRLHHISVSPMSGNGLRTDSELRVKIIIGVEVNVLGLICAVEIFNKSGTRFLFSNYDDMLLPPVTSVESGIYSLEMRIPPNIFAAGFYSIGIDLGIHNQRRIALDAARIDFQLENVSGIGRRYPRHDNVVRPCWEWNVLKISDANESAPDLLTCKS